MTYRAVGRLYRPPNLETQSAKSQQKQEPAALGLLCLLLALPVVVFQGRHGLLEQGIDFSRHPAWLYEGRVLRDLLYEVNARSSFGRGAAAARRVAAERDEFGAGPRSLLRAGVELGHVSRGGKRGRRG
jgi:hypothetical protein